MGMARHVIKSNQFVAKRMWGNFDNYRTCKVLVIRNNCPHPSNTLSCYVGTKLHFSETVAEFNISKIDPDPLDVAIRIW